jgi:hypothetical protein
MTYGPSERRETRPRGGIMPVATPHRRMANPGASSTEKIQMTLLRTSSVVAALLALTLPATAGSRRAVEGDFVTAESRFGNGTVSGPVRMGRFGREVRLPGGTWEPCKRSCAETLRAETVDFWYSRGPNAIAPECGIFGCLTLRYPR